MHPVYFPQLYELFRDFQRERRAEAEKSATAKEEQLSERNAKEPRASRPRFAFFGLARSALAHFL
jgi:hypothetical protein